MYYDKLCLIVMATDFLGSSDWNYVDESLFMLDGDSTWFCIPA